MKNIVWRTDKFLVQEYEGDIFGFVQLGMDGMPYSKDAVLIPKKQLMIFCEHFADENAKEKTVYRNIEVCPDCKGIGYDTSVGPSCKYNEDGTVSVNTKGIVCETCKGYGFILVATDVPDDITVIKNKIEK